MKRGNTEFRFPLHDILIVAGGVKEKKATIGALAKPWESVLETKSTDFLMLSNLRTTFFR